MGYYQPDKGGGISVYVRNVSERLVGRGHDVTVFATNPGGLPKFEVQNGVKVERFSRFAPSTAYFFSLSMLLRLRGVEFDVVHGHGYQAFPFHFSALAKHKLFVASTHYHGVGHSVFRNALIRLFRPFGERTLRVADRVVCVSEFEKSLVLSQFRVDPGKVVVVPCGVSFGDFEGLRKREHDFKSVLYVGRLEEYKGAQFLVEVLPRLDDGVVLEVVGKGPMRGVLERRARELGVFDRVRFFEELPRRVLLQMFVEADVFVLPSRYEAYSMVVAEALTAGTPCVVADASALSEWIDAKSCFGLDVPIRLDQLRNMINKVLNGEFDRRAIKDWKGKKIVDWNDAVKTLELIYQSNPYHLTKNK
jgi:glycosyltransferase involved in cell wall biosynthesis